MVITLFSHIHIDEHDVAWINNTTTKVIEIVLEHNAYQLNAAQIHSEHPHLSLAQIHAALSFYYDNLSTLDEEISRRYNRVEDLRAKATGQLTRQSLESRRDNSSASSFL